MTSQIDQAGDLRTWKSYEYIGPDHRYHDVHYQIDGGPAGGPHIWSDDSMWSIDLPAQPQAILPFIRYQHWLSEPPIDLRHATLRMTLRGDDLNLHGGHCLFWVVTYAPASQLWHHTYQPLTINNGDWAEPTDIQLLPNPEHWQSNSTTDVSAPKGGIVGALGACFSYGISFVGFSRKVTGRLSLGNFELLTDNTPSWPFIFNQRRPNAPWLTVSRDRQKKSSPLTQTPVLRLHDDFRLISEAVPFCYLAYLQSEPTTHRRDLKNAVLMVQQNIDWLDTKGGKVGFFIEHAASGTRWVLRVPIETTASQPWYQILPNDESLWFRLSGPLPLAELLGGQTGGARYDYLGLMIVSCLEEPSGSWELQQFSVGPTVDMAR